MNAVAEKPHIVLYCIVLLSVGQLSVVSC